MPIQPEGQKDDDNRVVVLMGIFRQENVAVFSFG